MSFAIVFGIISKNAIVEVHLHLTSLWEIRIGCPPREQVPLVSTITLKIKVL